MSKRPNGYIIYEGKSSLDGKPIVAIATGFEDKSTNIKTGALIQVWIIRSDISPLEATHSGEDSSICGDCRHRGILELQEDGSTRNKLRVCYVLEFQAPLQIHRTYKKGLYENTTKWSAEDRVALFAGRAARIGAYGDPAAVPDRVWAMVTLEATRWVGYTHQWESLPSDSFLKTILMASADTPAEAAAAQSMGWRTFRVGASPEAGEVSCPASAEMGKRVTCADCGLCAGAFRVAKNITIQPHGNRVISVRKRAPLRLAMA